MKVDVKHLAKLARLHISADQEQKFEGQMQDILEMVEKLPPISSADTLVDPENPMKCREDVPRNDFKRDDILKNAPQVQAGCVVVPKMIDE